MTGSAPDLAFCRSGAFRSARLGRGPIAAIAPGPGLGLGNQIFRGIAGLGGASTLDEVLSGTLGIVVPVLPFDAGYAPIGRLTISRGIRG